MNEKYDNEIELIDILRVIWKWKLLIIIGTFMFGILAWIISMKLPKIYRVDMVIQPGILRILETHGSVTTIYVDSPENIASLIKTRAFDSEILEYLRKSNNTRQDIKRITLKTNHRKNSKAIKISYETPNTTNGITILNGLQKILTEKYSGLVDYHKNELGMQIEQKKAELSEIRNEISDMLTKISKLEVEKENNVKQIKNDISVIEADTEDQIIEIKNNIIMLEAQREACVNQIDNLKERITGYKTELERISNNTQTLIKERDNFLKRVADENGVLSSIVYSNTIQQNIAFLNTLKNEMNDAGSQIFNENVKRKDFETQRKNLETKIAKLMETKKYKIEELNLKIENLKNDSKYEMDSLKTKINNLESSAKAVTEGIKYFEFKKARVQNVRIIQPPTVSSDPIKPKTRRNVMLASIVGLFIAVFAAFFLEYLIKCKGRK
jgi:capsular polysaccharide biosynthesis protein